MVQLQYTDNASYEDESNNLLYWAQLFKAETWEEFKRLANGNPAIEEVGNMIMQVNTDDAQREMLEAQRKYREQYASQYSAGYTDAEEKLNPIIEDLQSQNSDLQSQNSDLQSQNSDLQKLLDDYKRKYGDLN